MSSDASARGNEQTTDVSTVDSSSVLADNRSRTASKTSSALWNYSKQWSSKGFSRVFSKVFGPSSSQSAAKDAIPEKKPAEPQCAAIETKQSEKEEPLIDTSVAGKIVDCTDVDLSSDNQDIAVQTLMNLKRHAPSSKDPSQGSLKPIAKKTKNVVSAAAETKVHGRKLRGKNRGLDDLSPTHSELRPTKEVLYRPLSVNDLVTKRQEILSAVALVSRTLMSGSYPSPYKASFNERSDEESSLGIMDSTVSTTLHVTHMSAVCASLEKFTNDIIIPSFVGELHSTLVPESIDTEESIGVDIGATEHRTSDANETSTRPDTVLRAFFGTLLLLREVLVQNFDTVFGPYAASGIPIKEQIASKTESEIDQLSKQIFVTAIILTGISIFFGGVGDDGSRDQSEELIQSFFKCIGNYEYVN
jgi:hypothetical protein